jgi:HlyD family secretion protein
MIRRFLLPLLAIVGLGAAIFMVIQGNRTVPVIQPVVPSAQAPFTSSLFGPGIVEASSENIAIGTPVSGIVTAIYVKWGDRVKAGAPLFKVDTRDLEAQLLPANAKVKEMEAQLLPAAAKVNEAEATTAKA